MTTTPDAVPNDQNEDDTVGTDEEPIGIFDLDGSDTDVDITLVSGGEVVPLDGEDDEDDDSAGEEVPVEDDDTPATDGEPQAQPADEPDSGDTPPTDAPAPAATDTVPVESAPAAPEVQPLVLKADGREFSVAARKDADGNIIIAPDEWNRSIQPRLADRGAWARERETYQRQIASLDPNKNPEVVRAREITKAFRDMLDKGPDAVIEWAENYEANKETLMARAEAEAAKAELQALKEGHTVERAAEDYTALNEQMDRGIDGLLEKAATLDSYRELDMAHVKKVLQPMKAAIFFRAPQDMPEFGLQAGEIGVNLQVVDQVLAAEVERHNAYQSRDKARTDAAEAAKRNARALGTPAVPPVVTDRAVPGQSTQGQKKKPKDREDWEDQLSALTRA